jgi:hypothetical protein
LTSSSSSSWLVPLSLLLPSRVGTMTMVKMVSVVVVVAGWCCCFYCGMPWTGWLDWTDRRGGGDPRGWWDGFSLDLET